MTLTEFGIVIRQRIPTPDEFIAVANGQGWRIVVQTDGKASLRVPNAKDKLAIAFARMLSREPYRTNVLKAAASREQTTSKQQDLPPKKDEPPRVEQQCHGFTVPIGRLKTPTHVPCGAWFWVKEDCASACINRHCPQKEQR